MAATVVLSNAGIAGLHQQHHFGSSLAKRRNRLNMKTNATDNSVSFYNTDVPDFGRFLLSETFSDVQLVCGENRISAHRSRLGAVSPFLASIFAKDTSETSVVIFPDIKYETMRVLVHFVYTGFIRASESEVHDLLEAGCLLGIDKSIDVEQVNFGKNLPTEVRSQRKRQAPGGRNEKLAKKKTSHTQTVVIVDKFEEGNKMLPRSFVQPTKDPLDLTVITSNNIITVEDSSVQDASDVEEMEVCSSPIVTHQESAQDKISVMTAADCSEVASTSSSNLYTEAQLETTSVVSSPVVSAVKDSVELMEEVENVSKDNNTPNSPQTPIRKDDSDEQHEQGKDISPSVQAEFSNFVTNSTQPEDTQHKDMGSDASCVVSMAALDSPDGSGCSSSASTCAAPSPASSVHSEGDENMDAELQGESGKICSVETTQIKAVLDETKNTHDVNNVEELKDKIQISGIQSISESASASSDISTKATVNTIPLSNQETSESSDLSPVQNPVPTGQAGARPAETSSISQESPSQKPGLAKTVQQAVAGLLMWKSSKQKQANRSQGQQALPSPALSQNITTSKSNEPRTTEKRITVLTPKVAQSSKISDHDKEIIARELCSQFQGDQDRLSNDPLETPDPQGSYK